MSTQTYDALGFDPAPGVPASVHNLVTSLNKVGAQLNEAHQKLTRLGKADGAWQGEAASAFAEQIGALPKYLADGHHSVLDAAHALGTWETRLRDFQSLARRYEHEALMARKALKEAETNPDLELEGRTFDTEEALHDAQRRLDNAIKRVNDARDDLETIIKKAQELLAHHDEAASAAAKAISKAAEMAPDASLLDKLSDALKGLGDKIKGVAKDLWNWVKKHADTVYKIGDWLGWASAACDVLAVITSETIVGAVIFEGIGMTLNGAALAFHSVGWAAGAKKGSPMDIALDIAGFVPFGDFLRLGKVVGGARKGIRIPMHVVDFGAKAADSWKRALAIMDHVGGTAKLGADRTQWVMRNINKFGGKSPAIHITADTLKERFKLAITKEFGDYGLYKAGTGLTDKFFQNAMPKLIESTPLKNIPALADSVKPIVDHTGERVGSYIDPRSWTARGYDAASGAHNLYKEGIRFVTEEVQYKSEEIHEKVDHTRRLISEFPSSIGLR
ncbi:putative T7SS-secreted protein [Streptomyces thermodiastaticus]